MRWLLTLALVLAGSGALAGGPDQQIDIERMSAPLALEKVQAGQMILIDVRPHEAWTVTGIPQGAEMLDSDDPLFWDMVDVLTEGDKSKPIGLICYTGGRSAYVAEELTKRGYTRAVDIAEGMRGSDAGPGWIARGLPLTHPQPGG